MSLTSPLIDRIFRDWAWFAFSALASQGRLALAPSGGTCLICLTPAGRQYPKDQGDLSVFGTLQPAPKTDNLPNEALPAWPRRLLANQ